MVPQLIERDGVKLAFDVAGRGDPPLLFVHGWSCDRSFFDPQVRHFAATNTVATLDLAGHGESDQPDPAALRYEVQSFADDALAVAAAAGFDRPVVIGHSLGGLIALAVAARHGAARAGVMVDPAPIVADETMRSFIEQAADACAADDDAAWRTNFVQAMFLPTDTVRREEIVAGMSARPAPIASAAIRGIATFDGIAALKACAVPLLSIGSAVPTNRDEMLREACPHIAITQTFGSGHFNQLEVPDQVTSIIGKFLAVNGLAGS